jgi:hypothetical protein
MTKLMYTIGIVFVLLGLLWIGQGMGVVPGTFMTGDRMWAIWGSIEALLGAGLLILLSRGRSRSSGRRR